MISIFHGAEKHLKRRMRCGETPQNTDSRQKTRSVVRRNYLTGCFYPFCGAEKQLSKDIYQGRSPQTKALGG